MNRKIIKNIHAVSNQLEAIFAVATLLASVAITAGVLLASNEDDGIDTALESEAVQIASFLANSYGMSAGGSTNWPEDYATIVNVGLRAKIIKGIDMGVSFQRGDTFGIALSVTSLLGEQILPQKPDPPVHRKGSAV